MDTEIDWQRELDASFGSAPDVAAGHYVTAGRHAVRRRRAVAALVGVGAAAVVAGGAWSLAPSAEPRGTEAPVATQGTDPDATDAEELRAELRERQDQLEQMREAADARIDFLGEPGALTDHGLVLAPGAGPVLQRVANPMGYTPAQGSSLGIRVMFEGREQYSLMARFSDGGQSVNTNGASGDFSSWLDQAVRTQHTLDVANGDVPSAGDTSDGPWLVLGEEGQVETARSGIVVVEERAGVDLGPAFADGATRTGAVRLVVDGRTEYAAYRVVGGELDVLPGGSFGSLTAFLDWAREQYASGQGMR